MNNISSSTTVFCNECNSSVYKNNKKRKRESKEIPVFAEEASFPNENSSDFELLFLHISILKRNLNEHYSEESLAGQLAHSYFMGFMEGCRGAIELERREITLKMFSDHLKISRRIQQKIDEILITQFKKNNRLGF
jgi:hypothetical protein